ncbi:AzlD domain-containing protein [Pseudonocardia zijingensis]|jgi:branched-subunit amino acid transport protein|uniref:Branched-subunit amino acid transport protein AzlD n=1 Tax=Pseudonocardia zijingensis TaxID=153376 RepID=A0ABN1QMG8_9PSEU
MNALAIVATLVAAGAVSWLLRVIPITLLPAARLPAPARRLLDHAAPAAIAAMVGAGIAGGNALPELAARLPVLLGALVAGVIAWRRRGLVLPVVAGLAVAGALTAL